MLSPLTDRTAELAQLFSLLPDRLLEIPYAADKRPRECCLIEVSMENRRPHLRGASGKHFKVSGAPFHLRLEIFEMRPHRVAVGSVW